ncbi:hypothetical protein AAVH_14860, partial [Aphelenchoides avenae]
GFRHAHRRVDAHEDAGCVHSGTASAESLFVLNAHEASILPHVGGSPFESLRAKPDAI